MVNRDILVLGGMQPFFFPYPGYFSLIKATSKWIIFDIAQYEKNSWTNRNRIINLNSDDWKYITVPVKKHKLRTSISSIEIQNNINWKEKIIGQLDYYRRHAPYYKRVVEFLHEAIKIEFKCLSELNIHTLKATCSYIGLDFSFEIFSEMGIQLEPVHESDEWALNICKAMGVTEYINAERGQLFMNKNKFLNNNINLKFLEFGFPEYDQKREEFIPGLSILDAMMFNSPAELCHMLDEYQLVK